MTPLLAGAGQARLLGPHLRRLPLLLGEARLLRALQLPPPLLRSLHSIQLSDKTLVDIISHDLLSSLNVLHVPDGGG